MLNTKSSYSTVSGLSEYRDEEDFEKTRILLRKTQQAKRLSDIAVITLALIVFIQAVWTWGFGPNDPQICRGYQTDFASIRYTIHTEEREFSGWEWDDESQYVKRPIDSSKPQYFGDPKVYMEIDDNWDKLLEVQFFALSEEEAQDYPSLQPNMPGSDQRYMELDVTHKLHCVNKLRKLLYSHYYNQSVHALQSAGAPPNFYLEHMDHCLENIFDGVICHSDLTPAPMHSFVPRSKSAVFSVSGRHTCRNFPQVLEWLYERAKLRPSIGSNGMIYAKAEE